jgi:hypothetical protein
MRALQLARQRPVEHGAPAARPARPEIISDRQVQPRREQPAIADLHRQPGCRLVRQGLAVKADDDNLGAVDSLVGQKFFHRLGMRTADECVGFREHARPCRAIA